MIFAILFLRNLDLCNKHANYVEEYFEQADGFARTWLDAYIHLFGNIIDFSVPSGVPTSTPYLHVLVMLTFFKYILH